MATFSIRSSAIPQHAVVVGFRGVEALSRPYEIDVFFAVAGLEFVDLRDAVHSKAELTVEVPGAEAPMTFAGVLASVQLLRAIPGNALYVAKLVPQLWHASLTRHSRVFTKKTVVEILEEILDEAGIADYEIHVDGSFEKEEHVCQYKESNLAFMSRWMEREGLYYFFAHGPDGERLVITNTRSSHHSARSRPVRYFPLSGRDATSRQSFDDFSCTLSALPGAVKVGDYDYARPALDLSSAAPVSPVGLGEIVEHGARFFTSSEGRRLARLRAEELGAREVVHHAEGSADLLHAGLTFDLEDHPNPAYNKTYLITRVEHLGHEPSLSAAWGSLVRPEHEEPYRVKVDAIGAETQYRHPRVTPWPKVSGYENANVDGPATSQYAQLDEMGRYLVKFKFDEGSAKDGRASTFVRMVQPHDGAVEGHHFPLRKGVEVVCEFKDGDPDRPIIVGSVANAVTPSVVTSSNHTQNVIRTGALNHLVLDDTAGAMWVDLYCPIFSSTLFLGHGDYHFDLRSDGRGRVHTGLGLVVDVDAELSVDVVGPVDVDYHDALEWSVSGPVTIRHASSFEGSVGGAASQRFEGALSTEVRGPARFDLDATFEVNVTGNATYLHRAEVRSTIEGDLSAFVGGDARLETRGDKTEIVHGSVSETIDGSRTVHVKGAQTITVDAPQEWIRKDVHKATTYGATLDVFLGEKTTLQAGATFDAFVGLKNAVSVGVSNELSLSLRQSVTVGADLSLFAGLRASIAAALELSVSASRMSVTGTSIGVTGPSLSFSGPSVNVTAGPHLSLSAVDIFV